MQGMDIHATRESAAHVEQWPRWRVWSIRVWYGLLSLWTLSMAQWVARIWQAEPGERFVYGSVTAWKLLAVGGVLVICWTAGRSVVAFHTLVVGWSAWLLSERLFAVALPDETPVATALITVVLWLLPLIVLRPRRRELARVDLRPSAVLLPLGLVVAVPASVYAVRHGNLAIGFEGSTRLHYDACGLGAVLAAQAVFAGLRPRANRWLPRCVAFAAGWIGLLAVVWPKDLTSPGRGWGAAILCWAVLFAIAAEVEAKRDRARDDRSPAIVDLAP